MAAFDIFIIVSTVLLIIITVFILRFIFEATKLVSNFVEISNVVKSDLGPTLEDIQSILKNIRTVLDSTNKNISSVKGILGKIFGIGMLALTKAKGAAGSFKNGLLCGLNMFKK